MADDVQDRANSQVHYDYKPCMKNSSFKCNEGEARDASGSVFLGHRFIRCKLRWTRMKALASWVTVGDHGGQADQAASESIKYLGSKT
jgi:hypothetical protein